MCEAIYIGDIMVIEGSMYINGKYIKEVPYEIISSIYKPGFYYRHIKNDYYIIENYEYRNGEFKQTLRAKINKFFRYKCNKKSDKGSDKIEYYRRV